EVAQPGVDGGDVGGGHRGVLPHGPDDPPMSSWTAGTGRRFLPRAGPSPPAADPPRRVPESARVSCMTTDTTPADHGRPVLGVEDPAELLAQTRLSPAGPPTDCLILAGRPEAGAAAMITSSPPHEPPGLSQVSSLQRHLALQPARVS